MTAPAPVAIVARIYDACEEWSGADRADLAARLSRVGTTIGELSDARELLGFPRLSEASPEDRAFAHLNVGWPRVQTAIEQVRGARAWLLEVLGTVERRHVRAAKAQLGLNPKKSPRDLRLGELSALVGLSTELGETPKVRHVVDPQPFHSDEDLFAAAGGV